jgi:hypothetical protein
MVAEQLEIINETVPHNDIKEANQWPIKN